MSRVHICFLALENDADREETYFTSEIALSKWRHCYRSFQKISVFEMSTKGSLNCPRTKRHAYEIWSKGIIGRSANKRMKVCFSTVSGRCSDTNEERQAIMFLEHSVRFIAETVDQPRAPLHKILQNVSYYYPYNLSFVQQILGHDHSRQQV